MILSVPPKLTEPERERLLARLQADSDAANNEKFDWFFVRQAFKDHLVWGYALLFHGFAFVLYSLSLFMVRQTTNDIVEWTANLRFAAHYYRWSWLSKLASTTVMFLLIYGFDAC